MTQGFEMSEMCFKRCVVFIDSQSE